MKCPVCRAAYRPLEFRDRELGIGHSPTLNPQPSTPSAQNCRRCGVDLSPLIRLYDQAIWWHRQAIRAFKANDYSAAMNWNNRAIALHTHNADFHALAGQLWALQGEFGKAIASLKKTQQIEPKHPTAAFLQVVLQPKAEQQTG
jgi:tetratricopeptide (TPR) repeat protein